MIIALWVYKKTKYDLNYIGRDDLTAIDTYNMRKGVCHDFTKLGNALLYSLGYKIIYVSGNCYKTENENALHCWSLLKINEK